MSDDTFALELDDLEVERPLGAGAFGEVLLARAPGGRRVALKLLRDADPRRLERFRREAQLTARLDHPGIVRVHGAGSYRGRPAIVYALVEGGRTLDAVAPTLPLPARLGLVRDVARALAFAHARGVVHRDLKAENVLVDAEGRALLADFGLAAAVDSQTLTRTGQLVGTPYSMSPEQVLGQEAGAPADVWGLGVLLHLVVTGERPFDGETWTALADEVVRGRAAAPSSLVADAPAGLDDVVAAALRREPAARPSAAELAAALDAVLAGRGGRGGRRRLFLAASAAALAAAAAGGVIAARASGRAGGGERPPATVPPAAPPAGARAPRTGFEGWAAELAAVRSFSLLVDDRASVGPLVGRTIRLDGTLGPVAEGAPDGVLEVPLALSRLRIKDVGDGPAYDSAVVQPTRDDLPMRRYASELATARGRLLVEARTGVTRGVAGFAPKPTVAQDGALDMIGQIEATWGSVLPDGEWLRRCFGNLLSLAPGPGGERRLGSRALWTGWDDRFETELSLEPAGASRLRVAVRNARPASGTQGRRATFSGEVRLEGTWLAELRLEAEVETRNLRPRRVLQALTLEPPTR